MADQVQSLSDNTHYSLLEVNKNVDKITKVINIIYTESKENTEKMLSISSDSDSLIENSVEFKTGLSKTMGQLNMALEKVKDIYSINQNLSNEVATIARSTRDDLNTNEEIEKGLKNLAESSAKLKETLEEFKI